MAILIRCQCGNYYGLKHKKCTKCEKASSIKNYYVQHSVGGKRKLEFAGTNLQSARQLELERKIDKKAGRTMEQSKGDKLSFDKYIDDYFLPHYQQNKSWRNSVFMVNYFRNEFAGHLLVNITTHGIEKAVLAAVKSLGDSSLNNYITTIKRIFNYAIELDLTEKNPVKIKKSRKDLTRRRYITRDEQARLFAACRESKCAYLFDMVYISLMTGLRLGEVKAIKPSDITEDGFIYVRAETAKSKQERAVPLSLAMQEFFRNKALFDYNHDIGRPWDHAREASGLTSIVFHDLRRTFGSRLAQRGVSIYKISKLMGHSSVEITARHYAHLSPDSLRDAIEE